MRVLLTVLFVCTIANFTAKPSLSCDMSSLTESHTKKQRIVSKSKIVKTYLDIDQNISPVEMAILLVEYGKNTFRNNNPGNLRKGNLEYHQFPTLTDGMKKFRNTLKKRYSNCQNEKDPYHQIACIATSGYSENPEEWIDRVTKRYKQITQSE